MKFIDNIPNQEESFKSNNKKKMSFNETLSCANMIDNSSSSKQATPRCKNVDLGSMTLGERRRHKNNERGKQRIHNMNNQIDDLRYLLTESKVVFKPNKCSILMKSNELIKHLQSKSLLLESEYR